MARTHCGMDFGTSNSTLAAAGGNTPPRLLPLEDGKVTIPSAIFFSFEEDRIHHKEDDEEIAPPRPAAPAALSPGMAEALARVRALAASGLL